MEFIWDSAKSQANLRERHFDFAFASRIFDGPCLEREDCRRDYGERRLVAVGRVEEFCVTVVYTDRPRPGGGVVRRIISARKANRREREAYEGR